MIYDPMLEPGVVIRGASSEPWQARWIWYPGQLAAHLNTRIFQKAIRRCAHIGYPGSFRQPEYFAYYRYRTTLNEDREARWATPQGRTRMRINGREGDITVRSGRLPKGPLEILVMVDLTVSLPCFLMTGEGITSGEGWEASLDGLNWIPAEYAAEDGAPDRLPDLNIDSCVTLLPKKTVWVQAGVEQVGIYHLEPGGEALLDFWHDELGELEIEASGAGTLQVHVGESIIEVMDDDSQSAEQFPLEPLTLAEQSTRYRLPERCARFVRLSASQSCFIRRVVFHARVYPAQYRGVFECSDERVNEIWRAGAATLHSNLHDAAILDGLKRDGLVWLFDQNQGFDAVDCLFFDRDVVRNTLISKSLPPAPPPRDVGLPDNLMYYLIGFYQDYLASGDEAFIRRYADRIQDIFALLESVQDAESGFIAARAFAEKAEPRGQKQMEGVDYLSNFFPDWAAKSDSSAEPRPTDIDTSGTPAYAQMMLFHCFQAGAVFARLWDDSALAKRWEAMAERLRGSIRAAFWDEARGAFINGLTRSGERDERLTLHAQAWALLVGLLDEKAASRVAGETLAGLQPRAANLSMSTYWEYLAYLKAGRFDLALEGLCRYWGGMLDAGYSRFIEDIRPGDDEKAALVFYNRHYGLSLNQ